MTLGGCQGLALRKQADLVAHAGGAELGHPDPGLDRLGKGQRGEIVALRLDHQTDGLALVDVEHALLDQVGVDGGVEPAVIDDVVDMAVGVVVHPARGDGAKDSVGAARLGLGFGGTHRGRFCQRRQ